MRTILQKIILVLITIYQWVVRPILPRSCRFYPSCSDYSMEAVKKYGAMKGIWMTVKRLSRCHPFHAGGYDPVR